MVGLPIDPFWQRDTWSSELSLPLFAVSWGLWLTLPVETFASSHTFDAMAQLAPELVWGVFALLVGIVATAMPLLELRGLILLKARFYLSMIQAAMWMFIVVMFVQANFSSTATAIYSTLTLQSIIVTVALSARLASGRR